MKDPYEILGVNRNANEEEIKAAYKELARKYHPDNYADNPLSDLAEEKMKETNEAYDRIIAKKRNKGKSSGNYGSNGGSSEFADIRNMINANKLEEAQELIDGIDISRRNAEWYFLSGSVLYKRGWYDDAYSSFAAACRMDPSNMEFRAAFNRMNAQRSGKFYNGGYRTPNYNSGGCSTCDICSGLICADCCCECMGGDLISCC